MTLLTNLKLFIKARYIISGLIWVEFLGARNTAINTALWVSTRREILRREKKGETCAPLCLSLGGRTRVERSWKRLDALHPLLSDILTNSGAPRADNYFCGPRGPRLPLASSFTAGPPSCVARFSARPPPPSFFSSPSYTGTAIFRAESHRPFELFFARARGPRRGCGRKRVRGRGETLQRFKSSRDTHESTSHLRTLRTPTPPFRVTLRSISRYGPPFVGSLSDQRALMILIFHLCSLARLGFIYLRLCLCCYTCYIDRQSIVLDAPDKKMKSRLGSHT